jgi:hypothetical protein
MSPSLVMLTSVGHFVFLSGIGGSRIPTIMRVKWRDVTKVKLIDEKIPTVLAF